MWKIRRGCDGNKGAVISHNITVIIADNDVPDYCFKLLEEMIRLANSSAAKPRRKPSACPAGGEHEYPNDYTSGCNKCGRRRASS